MLLEQANRGGLHGQYMYHVWKGRKPEKYTTRKTDIDGRIILKCILNK
jgi:hypothetical protein